MTSGDVELVVSDEPIYVAAEMIASAVGRGGHVALSGGSTPRPAYELAARLEPDWSRVHVWLGDERCVPPDDERANVRLVRETLASASHPPVVHPVDTALSPGEAATRYGAELREVTLDLALQGLGTDGHTASLFPEAPSLLEESALAVSAAAGLEPWVDRVTMTIPMLSSAREVVFLVLGERKADAVRRAFVDGPSAATPASLVRSRSGKTIAILDPAAAAATGSA